MMKTGDEPPKTAFLPGDGGRIGGADRQNIAGSAYVSTAQSGVEPAAIRRFQNRTSEAAQVIADLNELAKLGLS
jgi:hypothetical protein